MSNFKIKKRQKITQNITKINITIPFKRLTFEAVALFGPLRRGDEIAPGERDHEERRSASRETREIVSPAVETESWREMYLTCISASEIGRAHV